MKKIFYVFILLVLGSLAYTQSVEERIQALEKLCQRQKEKLAILQKQIPQEEAYKAYTKRIVEEYLQDFAAQDDKTAITAGYEKGFFLRCLEGNLEWKFTGYIQTGLGLFENESFDNNSFSFNVIFLTFDMYAFKNWHTRIQMDVANTSGYRFGGGTYNLALRDAYIEYTAIPEFCIRAGQTFVPFSMQGQYPTSEFMTIMPDPFIRSWGVGRDTGLLFYGAIANMLSYKAGIFNGEGINRTNISDDFLTSGEMRFHYLGYKENPKSFFHVGFLRNRSENMTNISLISSWTRRLFPNTVTQHGRTEGWRTSVDVGFRLDLPFKGEHSFRVESEFMYSTWERDLSTGRRSYLEGYGCLFQFVYRHCFYPDIKGSGLIGGFAFSYTDLDNDSTDSLAANNNIPGQRIFSYTFILGYAFSKHLRLAFNWVIMDLDQKTYYGTAKDDGSAGGLENAWLFQLSALW